ncbi:hypothetical protein JTE90_009446 [Oedothorax gibbosus]|uniref:Uncharacterized protein n=1 Tax=Oedothorax gibbosus TaxID=931172 RepID=A0AAV6VU12_9ARAC|nr:hypothetical protein JTE90_009446 [Oedothorax gibbosus]
MFDYVCKVKDIIISGARTIYNGIFFNKPTENQNVEALNYADNLSNHSQSSPETYPFSIIESQCNKNNASQFFHDDGSQISCNYKGIRRLPLDLEDDIKEGKFVINNQELLRTSNCIYQPPNSEDTSKEEIPFNPNCSASSLGIIGQEIDLNYDDSLSEISNQTYKTAASEIIDEDNSSLQSGFLDQDNVSKFTDCEKMQPDLARPIQVRNYLKSIYIPQETASNLVLNNEYLIEHTSILTPEDTNANHFFRSRNKIFSNEYLATNHDRTMNRDEDNQECCFQALSDTAFLNNQYSLNPLSDESLIVNDASLSSETNKTILYDSNLYYKPVSKTTNGSISNTEETKLNILKPAPSSSSSIFQTSYKRKDNETDTKYIHRVSMPMAIQEELEATSFVQQTAHYLNFPETNNSRLRNQRNASTDYETYLENFYKEGNIKNVPAIGSNNITLFNLYDSTECTDSNTFCPKRNPEHVGPNMDATESRNIILSNLCNSFEVNAISSGDNSGQNVNYTITTGEQFYNPDTLRDKVTQMECLFCSQKKTNNEFCCELSSSHTATDSSNEISRNSHYVNTERNIISPGLNSEHNIDEETNATYFLTTKQNSECCTGATLSNSKILNTNIKKQKIVQPEPERILRNVRKNSLNSVVEESNIVSEGSHQTVSEEGDDDVLFLNEIPGPSNCYKTNLPGENQQILATPKIREEFRDTSELENAPKKRKTYVAKRSTSLEATAPLLLCRPSRLSFNRSEMNIKTLKSNASTSNEQKHLETRNTPKSGLMSPRSLDTSSEVKTNPQSKGPLNSNVIKLSTSSAPIKDNVKREFKVPSLSFQPKESLVSLDQMGDMNMPSSSTFNAGNNSSIRMDESSLFQDRSLSDLQSIIPGPSNCYKTNLSGQNQQILATPKIREEIRDTSELENAPKKRRTYVSKRSTSLEATAPLLLCRPSRLSFNRSEINIKTLKSNASTSNEQKHLETRNTPKSGLMSPRSLDTSSEVTTNPQSKGPLNSNVIKLSTSSAPIKDNVKREFKVPSLSFQPKESLVSLDQMGDMNMPSSSTFNAGNNSSMCMDESSLFQDRSLSDLQSISTGLDSYDMEHESNCLNQNVMDTDADLTIQISDTMLEDQEMEIGELE